LLGRRYGGNGNLRPDEFWAVKDVNFELKRGECQGLIGRNGAGKTTLLRMLNGLIKPDQGRVEMRGRVGALIALGAGFNPILTGRENIYVNASVLGLNKKETDSKIEEIINFSELAEFIDMPVQSYSSGMQVRLGFAIATSLEPDIILLDEVLAVGDAAFRTKCFERIGKLLTKCSVIFVSHNAVQVSRICDTCLYLSKGEQILIGSTDNVLRRYEEDNKALPGQESIVLHKTIDNFDITPKLKEIHYGESATIKLKVRAKQHFTSGLSLIALSENEMWVTQSDMTDIVNDALKMGDEIIIILGPLALREGEYSVAITILDESKKETIVHALNCATIRLRGPRGYGVAYQLPVTTTIASANKFQEK